MIINESRFIVAMTVEVSPEPAIATVVAWDLPDDPEAAAGVWVVTPAGRLVRDRADAWTFDIRMTAAVVAVEGGL
jgi:hypothetical protein